VTTIHTTWLEHRRRLLQGQVSIYHLANLGVPFTLCGKTIVMSGMQEMTSQDVAEGVTKCKKCAAAALQ
jgi:hypothetical protein